MFTFSVGLLVTAYTPTVVTVRDFFLYPPYIKSQLKLRPALTTQLRNMPFYKIGQVSEKRLTSVIEIH